jgi:hypothetical protein
MTSLAAPPRERSTSDEFLSLVLSDELWLRAEFDAIIAAGGDSLKTDRWREGDGRQRHRCSGLASPRRLRTVDQTGGSARSRQRSPPARSS